MTSVEQHNWWLLVWSVAVAGLFYLLSPILTPFVIAALLAYLGDPVVDRLEERHLPRTAAVTVVFLVLVALIVAALLVLLPRLEAQLSTLLNKLPGYLAWFETHVWPHVQGVLPGEAVAFDVNTLTDALQQHWTQAGGLAKGLVASITQSGLAIAGWLTNLVLIPVLTFYLLRDWDHLIDGVRSLLPRASMATWTGLAREADEVLGAFLRGQLLVMFALAVIYTTGLWLVGLDLALLIGMFAGIVSFVPYLGLIVGVLSAGIAAFLQFKGFGELPWVVVVFVVGQLLEGTLLTPRLVGDRIGLHPVAVIFAIMAGAQLYGFFGVLLALPVAAVAMVGLRHLLVRYRASSLYAGAD